MSEPTQTQTYRNPALTVDALVARRRESQDQSDTLSSDDATAMTSTDTVEVLLIQRGRAPFAGCWAFPGGFVDYGEDPRDAVVRELDEETHLKVAARPSADNNNNNNNNTAAGDPVSLVSVRGHPSRDPRQHIVTVAYAVRVDPASMGQMRSDDDAADARWFMLDDVCDEHGSQDKQGSKEKQIQLAFDHALLAREFRAWLRAEGAGERLTSFVV